jgi:hypothetical protein
MGGGFGDRRCHVAGDGHAMRLGSTAYGRDFSGYESEDGRGYPCSEYDITGARDMWGAEVGTGRRRISRSRRGALHGTRSR